MNRKLLTYSIITMISLSNFAPCFAGTTNDIFTSDKIIKDTLHLQEANIDTYIPYEMIYKVYEKQCDSTSIQSAQEIFDSVSEIRDKNIRQQKFTSTMQKRFSSIMTMLFSTEQEKKDLLCKQEYLLYKLLEITQTTYLTHINPTYTRPVLYHWSANTQKHSTYFINIQSDTKNLNSNDKKLAQQAEEYIQRELWNLIKLNLLNESDLKAIDNKIYINYKNSCENTKWSFHVLQSKSWREKQFKSIELNINLCDSESFKGNYENYVKQIFIHEISHYIYVFKDDNYKEFSKICWENWNTCSKSDFVSNYAQNNEAEDYAESLAYRYLDNFNGINKEKWSASNKILWKKILYFNDLLQRMQ